MNAPTSCRSPSRSPSPILLRARTSLCALAKAVDALRADADARAAAAESALSAVQAVQAKTDADDRAKDEAEARALRAALREALAESHQAEARDADVLACRVDGALEALDSSTEAFAQDRDIECAVAEARSRIQDSVSTLVIRFAQCLQQAPAIFEALSASVAREDRAAVAFLLRWGAFYAPTATLPYAHIVELAATHQAREEWLRLHAHAGARPPSPFEATEASVDILRLLLSDARIARGINARELLCRAIRSGNAGVVRGVFVRALTDCAELDDVFSLAYGLLYTSDLGDTRNSHVRVYATLLDESFRGGFRENALSPAVLEKHYALAVATFERRATFSRVSGDLCAAHTIASWDVVRCMLDDTTGRLDRVVVASVGTLLLSAARAPSLAPLTRVLDDERTAAVLGIARARDDACPLTPALLAAARAGRVDAVQVLVAHPHAAPRVCAEPAILSNILERVVLVGTIAEHRVVRALTTFLLADARMNLNLASLVSAIANAAARGRCHPDTMRCLVNHPSMSARSRVHALDVATALLQRDGWEGWIGVSAFNSAECVAVLRASTQTATQVAAELAAELATETEDVVSR